MTRGSSGGRCDVPPRHVRALAVCHLSPAVCGGGGGRGETEHDVSGGAAASSFSFCARRGGGEAGSLDHGPASSFGKGEGPARKRGVGRAVGACGRLVERRSRLRVLLPPELNSFFFPAQIFFGVNFDVGRTDKGGEGVNVVPLKGRRESAGRGPTYCPKRQREKSLRAFEALAGWKALPAGVCRGFVSLGVLVCKISF